MANLFQILELTADENTVEKFEEDFKAGELMYSDLKDSVYEHLMNTLKPIRRKKEELKKNPDRVKKILARGREKARDIAVENMAKVRRLVGIRD